MDRVGRLARLTRATARVSHSPNWTIEILGGLVIMLFIALLATFGQLSRALTENERIAGDAEFWHEFALAPDTRARVVLDHDGERFRCQNFNVEPAWELAVAAECEVMGGLLSMAKYSAEHRLHYTTKGKR